MQVKQVSKQEKPAFEPVTIEVTFETKEELLLMYALYNCADGLLYSVLEKGNAFHSKDTQKSTLTSWALFDKLDNIIEQIL